MNNDARSASSRLTNAQPAIFAAMAALAVYAVTLAGGFAYDFYAISKDDTHLRQPSQWGIYWTQSYNGGVDNLYRPLTSTFLALESLIFGLAPSDTWKFHLISWLLNAGVCALVAEFARRLTNWRIAVIAGLLYAVHPIHVEVLGDIVGQAEMLCAIGVVGSMVLFLHRPMTGSRALAIFGCFVLALLSKESGMLLPPLILLLWLCARRSTPAEKQPMQVLAILLCFGLGAYLFIRENILKLHFWWDRSFLDPVINPIVLSHGKDRLLMPLVLIGHCVQLLIFPWKLSPDYSGQAIGSIVHFGDPYLYLGIAAIIGWCALAIIATNAALSYDDCHPERTREGSGLGVQSQILREYAQDDKIPPQTRSASIAICWRAGVVLFCLLGLAITYGLVGNIVAIIGTNFAERLMYLPSVFFLILGAIGLSKLPARPMIGITAILIILGSIRTVTYARRWNDRLALYEQAARDQPGAIRMKMLLATELADRGENAAAMAALAEAQRQMPDYRGLWDFSAALAMRLGDFNLAEQDLKRSMALGPTLRSVNLQQQLADARAEAAKASSTPATQRK